MYTVALLAMLSPVFLPLAIVAWFVYNSAKKEVKNDEIGRYTYIKPDAGCDQILAGK